MKNAIRESGRPGLKPDHTKHRRAHEDRAPDAGEAAGEHAVVNTGGERGWCACTVKIDAELDADQEGDQGCNREDLQVGDEDDGEDCEPSRFDKEPDRMSIERVILGTEQTPSPEGRQAGDTLASNRIGQIVRVPPAQFTFDCSHFSPTAI